MAVPVVWMLLSRQCRLAKHEGLFRSQAFGLDDRVELCLFAAGDERVPAVNAPAQVVGDTPNRFV